MVKEISTQEIKELIAAGADNLYVRYSAGPEIDYNATSRDWAAGQSHAQHTLSVNNLIPQDEKIEYDDFGYWISTKWVGNWALYHALGEDFLVRKLREYRFLPGRPWIMRAERVGTDSDGGPLVDSTTFEFLGWWIDDSQP